MADAAALGIHPPSTVRIDLSGWVQDWPWECIELLGDRVRINIPDVQAQQRAELGLITVIHYPYEHARQLKDGTWIFHGREDFTVRAGPAQAPAMDTAGPQQ